MELEMANPFTMNEAARSGPLADAAERLDRVVSIVRDQQRARTNSGEPPKESEVFVLSPEEAWSKKYMIQCVGPVCTVRPTAEGALLLPRFAPAPPVKQASAGVELAPQKAPELKATPLKSSRKASPEPIGLAIGKPVRKRSLLGRLFRP
jgi:hypothetical protein